MEARILKLSGVFFFLRGKPEEARCLFHRLIVSLQSANAHKQKQQHKQQPKKQNPSKLHSNSTLQQNPSKLHSNSTLQQKLKQQQNSVKLYSSNMLHRCNAATVTDEAEAIVLYGVTWYNNGFLARERKTEHGASVYACVNVSVCFCVCLCVCLCLRFYIYLI